MKTGRFTTGIVGLCARLAFALAALLFLPILGADDANASSCDSQYRMDHSDSDCMTAWWDNSPNFNCWGTEGGAQSSCSDYGRVVVKVDLQSHSDLTAHRTNSSKWFYRNCFTDTRAISCCIDISDLCVKNQVEADDNDKIKYFKSGNSTLQTASVGTRMERYNFCQNNPNTVYCDVNPEGDALWSPNCGDHDCTVGDCNWHWNQSDASESSLCTKQDMTYDGSNFHTPKCNVKWLCEGHLNGVWRIRRDTTAFKMWDVDDLQICDLEVKVSCD